MYLEARWGRLVVRWCQYLCKRCDRAVGDHLASAVSPRIIAALSTGHRWLPALPPAPRPSGTDLRIGRSRDLSRP